MTVTADKTSYETGSIVTLAFKGLDVNGLILPDAYSYGITSTSDIAVAGVNASGIVSLPSTNLGTSIKFGGLGSAGVGNTTIDAAGTLWPYASATPGVVTVKFYAPLVQGPFNITVKRAATNYATAIAATSSVLALNASNAVAVAAAETSQAALDAAAEATDAANAATDAANAAAEAADAATAAAQDAADAVAALSTSVSAMINALKKQITSLTNLVIKIQKKVKA
jgi:flagellin-like hook-associated protein FlgL